MPREVLVATVVVVFSCVAVLEVTTSKEESSVPTVVNQYNHHGPDEFSWGYRVSDNRDVSQIISKKTLEDGREIVQIEGSYSHIGPDGKEYKMHYFADENGYHPNARTPILTAAVTVKPTNAQRPLPQHTPRPTPAYTTTVPVFQTETSISRECLLSLCGR
uniref:Putative larval cuticle protein n=1 Tax=Aedes albopictus TaxID=7160 RepID=A0A023EFY7_AEDAL|nr:larval cuticle protein 65Ag1-like [Aedes albopictus]